MDGGVRAEIQPLKMRQLFRFLRIVTRGGAQFLPSLDLSSGDPDQFGTQLLSIALLAVPEAENEAVDFLVSVTQPVGLEEETTNEAKKRNQERYDRLARVLDNPDPGDVVTVIETVLAREKDDLVALGKRLQGAFNVAVKAGQVPGRDKTETVPTRESTTPETGPGEGVEVVHPDQSAETIPRADRGTPASSVGSPAPSTSSPASTGGPTPSSPTSLSGG